MEQFYKIEYSDRLNILVQDYYQQVTEAEHNLSHENRFRMHQLKGHYSQIRKASVFIQRLMRGFLARLLIKRQKAKVAEERNVRYYHNQAVIIQRYFRGYYHRKKLYLQQLKEKNDQFQQELKEIEQREILLKKSIEEDTAKEEFTRLAANLHHLSSTRIQPGVYNKPQQKKDMVFDLDIETHLKVIFHNKYPNIKKTQQFRYQQSLESLKPSTTLNRYSSGGGTGKFTFSTKLQPISK